MLPRIATLACALMVAANVHLMTSQAGRSDGWLWDERGRPLMTDYIALWGAGDLVRAGRPAAAYDWQAHTDAMEKGLGWRHPPFPFAYPPTFLLVVGLLAGLAYVPSMLVWIASTFALYAGVVTRIVGRWQAAIWLSAPYVVFSNAYAGQNGFLTAALMGGGLAALPTRPVLAGALIGALSIKPHLGLLIPLALAAAGCWRAFAAAAATAIGLAAVSALLLGYGVWEAFAANLLAFGSTVASERYDVPFKLQSLYGMLMTLGAPRPLALSMQVVVALGLAAAVTVAWRSRAPYAVKAALLATAAVLASPYTFIYDLVLLAVAQAFMLRHWLETRLETMDAIALVGVNVLTMLFLPLAFPTGGAASLMMLAIVLREAAPAMRALVKPMVRVGQAAA